MGSLISRFSSKASAPLSKQTRLWRYLEVALSKIPSPKTSQWYQPKEGGIKALVPESRDHLNWALAVPINVGVVLPYRTSLVRDYSGLIPRRKELHVFSCNILILGVMQCNRICVAHKWR